MEMTVDGEFVSEFIMSPKNINSEISTHTVKKKLLKLLNFQVIFKKCFIR